MITNIFYTIYVVHSSTRTPRTTDKWQTAPHSLGRAARAHGAARSSPVSQAPCPRKTAIAIAPSARCQPDARCRCIAQIRPTGGGSTLFLFYFRVRGMSFIITTAIRDGLHAEWTLSLLGIVCYWYFGIKQSLTLNHRDGDCARGLIPRSLGQEPLRHIAL